jgi:hypothetical protein
LYGGANASTQLEGWGDGNRFGDVQTHRSTISFAFTFRSELFPNNLKKKTKCCSFPLKLSTLLPLQMLKNVFGYVNSLQIWATINLPLSLFIVTTNLPFCCPRISSFIVDSNILLFGITM